MRSTRPDKAGGVLLRSRLNWRVWASYSLSHRQEDELLIEIATGTGFITLGPVAAVRELNGARRLH